MELDRLDEIIEEIEKYGADLDTAMLFLKSNDSLQEYTNLMKHYCRELASGKTIADLPNPELWIRIQNKLVTLLLLFADAHD